MKETIERHPLFAGIDTLLAKAQMTVKDFAAWLDRPYMTVKEWVDRGVAPSDCFHLEIKERVDLLKQAIEAADGVPLFPNRRAKRTEDRMAEVVTLYNAEKQKCLILAKSPPKSSKSKGSSKGPGARSKRVSARSKPSSKRSSKSQPTKAASRASKGSSTRSKHVSV